MGKSGTFSNKRTLIAIQNNLKDRCCKFWHSLLFNDDRAVGGNKLRTYRKFKNDFKREQYLYTYVDKQSLSNYTRIRISNCNYLKIEKGRYVNLLVEKKDMSVMP